jgi:hypothetical protein
VGLEDGATNRGDHRRSIERAQGGALDLGGDADLLDPVEDVDELRCTASSVRIEVED